MQSHRTAVVGVVLGLTEWRTGTERARASFGWAAGLRLAARLTRRES
jgi:hypothetical protein